MGRTSDARERLIETAAALWHARSYAEVGVSEICAAADVRKGSFYHFFPSKSELARAVIDHGWARFHDEIAAPVLASELPPLARFARIIELEARFQSALKEESGAMHGCPFGNLAAEMSTVDEAVRVRLERLFEQWLEFAESLLREAIDAGELPAETDSARAARAMQAYAEGLMLMAKTLNDPDLLLELGPEMLRLAGATPEQVSAAVATAA